MSSIFLPVSFSVLFSSFLVDLFVCIFIGNLISLACFFAIIFDGLVLLTVNRAGSRQDVYSSFLLRNGGENVTRRRIWRKTSKFIKYEFIRVPRKKEINFHKFESQIKLRMRREKKSTQVVCCLEAFYTPRHTCSTPATCHLTTLVSAFCGFCVPLAVEGLSRANISKSSCIFQRVIWNGN
jgi:hypothetical protein